ncbi:MAG: hypothetical protein J5I47_05065 [Vicingus serpentipes]|nr:hypothetical protein [Vicingus serpentipes]
MGITQDNTLELIQLAKNDIPVILTTDNYITTAGVHSKISFSVNTAATGAGKTLIIAWGLTELTFTTAASPDDSGLEIPRKEDYGSTVDYAAAVAEYLLKNEILNNNFYVWSQSFGVNLVAKIAGEDYDVSTGVSGTLNVTTSSPVAGVDEVRNSDVKIVIGVYVFEEVVTIGGDDLDHYEKVKTIELEPLDNSKATFYLQNTLLPYFIERIIPSFNQNSITASSDFLLKFYYRYAERSETSSASATQSDIMYAVNGGLNRKDFEENSFYDDLITGASSKFLTWHPTTKYLTKQQHDYLYFIRTTTSHAIAVRYVATLTDGTTETIDITSIVTVAYDGVIIPVGYNYVNGLAFTKDVVAYDVQVFQKLVPSGTIGDSLSEVRTYKIIDNTPLLAKYYLFKNSLSAYESICFTGERTTTTEIDKKVSTRSLTNDDDHTVNEDIVSNVQYRYIKKFATGYQTEDQRNFLLEFLKSEDIYEQTADHYKPVTLKSVKSIINVEQEFISSSPIEITDNNEKNYSNA